MILCIPAYKPQQQLLDLVKQLVAADESVQLLIVNDGSGDAYQSVFLELSQFAQVTVISHAVNQGKGAALKTGFAYYLSQTAWAHSPGLVTADADGQHTVSAMIQLSQALAQAPRHLHLGVRQFGGDQVPWRSRFGNRLTRCLLYAVHGLALSDSQTGLRAIPRSLLSDLLASPLTGYEFELDMLIMAKKKAFLFKETPINTIYLDQNKGSHFNPLIDSIKIYFVLLRFICVSLCTAIVDFVCFWLVFYVQKKILLSVLLARVISGGFNFSLNRSTVFKSHAWLWVAMKYTWLAFTLACLSYLLMQYVFTSQGLYWSKIWAESALFFLSFAVQRFIVFKR